MPIKYLDQEPEDTGVPPTPGSKKISYIEEAPSFLEELQGEAPQMVGGIIGGVTGAMKGGAVGGPVGAVIGGLGGAFIGGMGGESYKQLYQHYTGDPEAPNTSDEAAKRIFLAGGEEALYEAGGQAVTRIASRTFHALRPKASKGIDELSKLFGKYDGSFTAAQRTENWFVHQLDGLTRGSLTGSGIMRQADVLNNEALLKMQDDLSTAIAKTATKNLSDRELGELFLNTVNKGQAAHKVAVNNLYSSFDDLVETKVVSKNVTTQVPTGIMSPTGEEVMRTTTKKVIEEIRPVQMSGFKQSAKELAAKIQRVAGLGIGDIGKDVLSKMGNIDDTMKFSDAQYLRSTLLDMHRGIKNTPGEEKLAKNLTRFVDDITKAMDFAAANVGETAKYEAIKKFARKGYEAFNNDFIANMIVADKKNAERIGEHIFRSGNVTEIKQTKLALRRAAQFDPSIEYSQVWGQMQQGYLEGMLQKASKEMASEAGETLTEFQTKSGVADANKLLKNFTDPKLSRTLSAVFTKEQRNSMFDFIKVASRVQKKAEGGLGMVMQLAQGGAIVGTATGTIDPQYAAAVFIPTAILAKMMTHPTTVRMMTTAAQTPVRHVSGAAQIAKLLGAVGQAYESEGKAFNYVEPMPSPMGVTER